MEFTFSTIGAVPHPDMLFEYARSRVMSRGLKKVFMGDSAFCSSKNPKVILHFTFVCIGVSRTRVQLSITRGETLTRFECEGSYFYDCVDTVISKSLSSLDVCVGSG